MATLRNPVPSPQPIDTPRRGSRETIIGKAANEFVFAVVGHAGSGTSVIAQQLHEVLLDSKIDGQPFRSEILKARDVIEEWARKKGRAIPPGTGKKLLANVRTLQDYGDEMRGEQGRGKGTEDHAAIARGLVLKIRQARAAQMGLPTSGGTEIAPDGKPRAYILDCLRHPAEVNMLRRIYEDSFVLIGVVCEEEKRIKRISTKYSDAGREAALDFMTRDADSDIKHGQHVAAAFDLADFFIDNTVEREITNGTANPDWDIAERLSRLVKIITHFEVVRPEISETAMHHAYGAQLQSACLSRQVGAAVVDKIGNVISTGTNEVPKAGGGVYGESFAGDVLDGRCAMFYDPNKRYCRNTREQNEIIKELINKIPELNNASSERKRDLELELRKTKIGALLEFSRAVHAEMDALLSAARQGVSLVGARLFVTTFPCHYCARHIVTAGIDEVQYIETYQKSKALSLHDDSIQVEYSGWKPPSELGSKVLFRPFSGIAPRLYKRAFMKDRDLKDNQSGDLKIAQPHWGTPWHLPRSSYVEIEAELAREEESDGNRGS